MLILNKTCVIPNDVGRCNFSTLRHYYHFVLQYSVRIMKSENLQTLNINLTDCIIYSLVCTKKRFNINNRGI